MTPEHSAGGIRIHQTRTVGGYRNSPVWKKLNEHYTNFRTQVAIAEAFTRRSVGLNDGACRIISAKSDCTYCIIGDVHGEFETLLNIICHARTVITGQLHFILLGDCIDRGEGDFAVLALIQDSLLGRNRDEFTLTYLCGNHDFAVDMMPNGYFYSAVSPADTTNHLNTLSKSGHASDALLLGKAVMELARTSPYVAELVWGQQQESAFLLAHAAPPHTDNQQQLRALYSGKNCHNLYTDLPTDLLYPCRDDLMRGILRMQQMRVAPNRGFLATAQGTEDAADYFDLHRELTGRRIIGMFRGHDHVAHGGSITPTRNAFICTLNAMGAGNTTVAHWQPGLPITLYSF